MLGKILVLFLISSVCFGQSIPKPIIEFNPKSYVCYRTNNVLSVDGKLDESDWDLATWTDYFIDIEGLSKQIPRFNTRAKMLWDEEYFYIAAELMEPDIWATLKNRDDIIFFDNDFEVFIDPDNNTHGYAEFEMNAFNTVWDLLLIQPYRDIDNAALHGWDIKDLQSGVEVFGTLNKTGDTDSCWTVEIAFPWHAFKEISKANCPPLNKDQWRVNFSRVEWQTEIVDNKYQKILNKETNKPLPEDNWVWSPQGVVNMHYPEMWGFVQFSTIKVGEQETDFIPQIDDQAKWNLRQLYYAEKKYKSEHGSYTKDLKKLNLEFEDVCNFESKPVIEATTNTYEAILKSVDGNYLLKIDNTGLVSKIIRSKKE